MELAATRLFFFSFFFFFYVFRYPAKVKVVFKKYTESRLSQPTGRRKKTKADSLIFFASPAGA